MKYGINSYEERLQGKPLIDWEYLYLHPEQVSFVWENYLLNNIFRFEVNRRLSSKNPLDQIFAVKFYEYFGDLLAETKTTTRA